MLDEEEFKIAYKLYGESFGRRKTGMTRELAFEPLLKYYEKISGFKETEPNAIMHHRISDYGSICKNCGKPYRIPKASYCAACGNKQ